MPERIIPDIPLVYVAGPYRAPTPQQMAQHIYLAEQAALRIWGMGATAFVPHLNTGQLTGTLDDEIFRQGYRAALRRCDALFLLPGWHTSVGTQEEYADAVALGIPIFETMLHLARWIVSSAAQRVAPIKVVDRRSGTQVWPQEEVDE